MNDSYLGERSRIRVMRSTVYAPPDLNPMTTVTREHDMTVPLEEIGGGFEWLFIVHDIFDMPRGTSIEEATSTAMNRIKPDHERNMAILFYWSMQEWERLRPHGTLVTQRPAPLTADEIRYVFKALVRHPDYQHFRLVSHSQDGELVEVQA